MDYIMSLKGTNQPKLDDFIFPEYRTFTTIKPSPVFKDNISETNYIHRVFENDIDGDLLINYEYNIKLEDFTNEEYIELMQLNGQEVDFYPHNDYLLHYKVYVDITEYNKNEKYRVNSLKLVLSTIAGTKQSGVILINSILLNGSQVIKLPSSLVEYLQSFGLNDIYIMYNGKAEIDEGGGILSFGQHDYDLFWNEKWKNGSGFSLSHNLEGYNPGYGVTVEDKTNLICVSKNNDWDSRSIGAIGISYSIVQSIIHRIGENLTSYTARNLSIGSLGGSASAIPLIEIMPNNYEHFLGSFVGNELNIIKTIGYKGYISDLRIYANNTGSRDLTVDEISLYLKGESFDNSPDLTLVAQYDFNDNLNDSSGNGFDALLTSGVVSYQVNPFWLNTVSYYKLNDDSGLTVIDSNGSNDLSSSTDLSNMTVKGKFNKALDFKGSYSLSGFIGVNSNHARCVSFWIKVDNLPLNNQAIMVLDSSEMRVSFRDNGTRLAVSWTDSLDKKMAKTDTLILGEWNHIVVNYSVSDGTGVYKGYSTVYINAVECEYDGAYSLGHYGVNFIGRDYAGNFLDGLLDEIIFFEQYNLKTKEVEYLYNAGNGREKP